MQTLVRADLTRTVLLVLIIGVLIVGDKFMSKLAPADQDIVREGGRLAADAQVEAVLARQDDAIAELAAHGIEVIEPDDINLFVEKVKGVYGENEERIGVDLIKTAQEYAAA